MLSWEWIPRCTRKPPWTWYITPLSMVSIWIVVLCVNHVCCVLVSRLAVTISRRESIRRVPYTCTMSQSKYKIYNSARIGHVVKGMPITVFDMEMERTGWFVWSCVLVQVYVCMCVLDYGCVSMCVHCLYLVKNRTEYIATVSWLWWVGRGVLQKHASQLAFEVQCRLENVH